MESSGRWPDPSVPPVLGIRPDPAARPGADQGDDAAAFALGVMRAGLPIR